MKRLAILVAIVALVAAACSSDDDAADTTTTAGTAETTTTEAAPTGVQALADACAPGETDGDLNFANWTEYTPLELLDSFEEEYGVNATLTEYADNETMLAQVAAGVAYDVVVPSDYMVSIMKDADLLVKVNQAAVPNLAANIAPLFKEASYDPGNEYSAPYQWGTTGIGYLYGSIDDTDGVSWAVIFDADVSAANAGLISLLDDTRETLGSALKYLGYSLNTTVESEVDEAAQLISDTKGRLAAFNSSSYWTLLTTGETVVAQGWNGDFLAEYDSISTDDYDAYADYGYAIPNEGSAAWVDTLAIPTTAEHPCTAQAFLNHMLDAENGGAITNFNYYASPNAAAAEFILPEILDDPSIYPPPATMEILEFFADLGDFNNYYADAFAIAKG
jgi:spermidine/putrescine-binding protein